MIDNIVRKVMKHFGYLDMPKNEFTESIQELEDMAKQLAEKDLELERHYALVEVENNILKKITEGSTMYDVLSEIVETIENFGDMSIASILIYKEGKLWDYCSPSLSEEYIDLLKDGFPIGPNNGSCGAAGWYKEPVYVDDISTHPNWTAFPEVLEKAQEMGIVSCYSAPILGTEKAVLGTVAIYCKEVVICREVHARLLEWSAKIAAIMIEKDETLITLHEKTEQLRGILESQQDLILRFGVDKKIIYANQAYKDTFGVTEQEIKNKTFHYDSPIHPEDKENVSCTIEEFLRTPPYRSTCELRALTTNGEYRWFEWHGWAIFGKNSNDIVAIQASGRDITERIENTLIIDEKNKLLKAIIDAAGSYLWFKDKDHKYRFVDRGFLNNFFLVDNSKDILGKNDIEILSEIKKLVRLRHDFGEICVGSDEHSRQQRIQCRYIEGGYIDDKLTILEVIKTPLFNEEGIYTGNIGAAWDRSDEFESIIRDKKILQAQDRIEILGEKEYPETPFVWWIKPKVTHYKDVTALSISEEASILEKRIEDLKNIKEQEIT